MRVFCIGSSTYDVTFPLEHFLTENTKVKVNEKIECSGGTSLTAAILLSRWHEDSYLVSSIGKDIYGEKILDQLLLENVNLKYLNIDKNIHTNTSFILASKKNKTRTITTYKDIDNNFNLNINKKPDVIYFDGEYFDFSIKLIEKFKDSLKIIDAGSVKQNIKDLCKHMDYIVCSKNFAEDITKIDIDKNNLDTVKAAYLKLEKKYNGKIIITLEEKGSFAKIDGEYKLIPSIKVKVLDSTGAGDVFHGAFTYFISNGYDYEKAILLSNIAGAFACTKYGSSLSIPSLEEVLKYDK